VNNDQRVDSIDFGRYATALTWLKDYQGGAAFDAPNIIGGSLGVPTPEPSTVALFAGAGACLLAVRRRFAHNRRAA